MIFKLSTAALRFGRFETKEMAKLRLQKVEYRFLDAQFQLQHNVNSGIGNATKEISVLLS